MIKKHVWEHRQALIGKRLNAGQSLRQLGEELNISYTNISRIERGNGTPNTHIKSILEHWLFPEKDQIPCPCARCKGSSPSLIARVEALEDAMEEITYERLFDTSRRIG